MNKLLHAHIILMTKLAVNSYVTQILWSIVNACNFVRMFEQTIKSFNSVLIVSFMTQPVKKDECGE